MYGYEWTDKNGIYKLSINSKIEKEIRPVFKEELDYFGLNEYWKYPKNTKAPLLWAEGIRRYILNGECIAEGSGGGFYTKPTVKIKKEGLKLKSINVNTLWKENERLMLGLEKTAIDFIRKIYDEYSQKGMAFAVAFSGGKDSIVLLDLVSRALSPDKFIVVFSNTGMELSKTLEAVEKAKKHWPSLKFYEARSHMDPETSWDEFGPPGRRMRWCCSVHKSVPTIILLRELTGNYNIKAVIFDGIRAEESAARANRDEVSIGTKNINQINCSPILKWNTAELFVYLLHRGILFNDAYRQGLFRVGCIVCPLSSRWWDGIINDIYPDETRELLSKVEAYAAATKPKSEVKKFIEEGGWKARIGGRGLKNGGNRVYEKILNNKISFSFAANKQEWLNVSAILGPVVEQDGDVYSQLIDNHEYKFSFSGENNNTVTYWPYSKMNRFVISHLRGIAYKTAYCIGCKTCEVQCPVNAFIVTDDRKIYIREDKCIHCYKCMEFTSKACLVSRSLAISGGRNGMDLKGMNRYQHFGFRKLWLEHFFQHKEDCFTLGQLGNRQYDALKVWLREAGLLSVSDTKNKSGVPTPLFKKLESLGAGNPLTWAIIWTNLAYNSIICKWYMLNVSNGEYFTKNDLVLQLGDDYSKSSRDNAVTALLETLRHSPIGALLKQGVYIGSGSNTKYLRTGWDPPDAVAILYALYLWAEATGRYDFSLKQLTDSRANAASKGLDPVVIFGINPEKFKDILQAIAIQFEEYLHASFVADLDNVKLFPKFTSLDILNLIRE